jgi:signal transduction histidine kinase
MQAVRRLAYSPWLLAIIVLASVELVMLGGSAGGTHQPDRRPLDAIGYSLLALAGVCIVASRRWPLPAFGTALGTIVVYGRLGYPTDGPVFLSVPITLYSAVSPERLWTNVGLGALAVLGLALAYADTPLGDAGLDLLRLLMLPLGIAAVVVVASLMGSRSRQLARLRQAEAQRLVTEERLRIARELHDVVSHTIATINVQAGVAAHLLDNNGRPEQTREALLAIKSASKEALDELRGILHLLRQADDAEPRDPAPSLEQVDALAQATTRAGLPTVVRIDGEVRRLSPAVELTAYRVVQEALTNALRYAAGASAQVSLVYEPRRVVVEVVDSGPGLASGTLGTGHGLRGIRERVAAVGGQVEVGPRQEGGFLVRASLPASSG